MINITENEITYDDGVYSVNHNDDGTKTFHCPKNKRGFKITIHVGGTEDRRRQSSEAIKSFYINNIL